MIWSRVTHYNNSVNDVPPDAIYERVANFNWPTKIIGFVYYTISEKNHVSKS